jgi:hypothetical protein
MATHSEDEGVAGATLPPTGRPSAPRAPDRAAGLRPPIQASAAPRPGVLLLVLALIPVQAFWLVRVETELGAFGTNNTDVSLFFTTVFALLIAGLWNRRLEQRGSRWALLPSELAALYIGLTISAAFSGSDLLQNLTPVLVHPFWFASAENGWQSLFHAYIPAWFAPRDPEVLKGYYIGHSTLYTRAQIDAWLTPMAIWGALLFVIGGMMLCLNVLVQRQWTDRERLTYPVIQLPLEMVRPGGLRALLSNRLFTGAVLVTVALETINILNSFYPSVPHLQLGIVNVGQYFVDPPWNALATWPPLFLSWIPFAIGISFFLPLDLAFSAWAFYLLRRAEDVLAVYWGWRDPGASAGQLRFPFVREQASGAWIALFLLTFWMGRRHYRAVLRAALGLDRTGDPGEARRYRGALLGLLAGALYLLTFSRIAGMALWVAAAYFCLYFMLILTMTRIRAQLGPPMLELYFVNPEQILVAFTGTHMLGGPTLTVLSYYFWFNRCYRCQPMAHQLESFRLADATGLPRSTLVRLILAALAVGIVFCLWAILHVYYDAGESSAKILTYRTGVGREAFNRLEDWLRNPRGPDAQGLRWMAGGALFTFALAFMQSRFLWWPFHPIGYAFSTCYAMEYWWSTIALCWFIKLLLVRYGGLKAYVRARPLFLGLILGDAVVACVLAFLSWLFGWHGISRY